MRAAHRIALPELDNKYLRVLAKAWDRPGAKLRPELVFVVNLRKEPASDPGYEDFGKIVSPSDDSCEPTTQPENPRANIPGGGRPGHFHELIESVLQNMIEKCRVDTSRPVTISRVSMLGNLLFPPLHDDRGPVHNFGLPRSISIYAVDRWPCMYSYLDFTPEGAPRSPQMKITVLATG